MQRIILQKSAEWTPKKSKKKVREEGESFGDEPNSSCAKVRRSSSKKKKVKKVAEEEDDDDEHSDANMLLLLSASKPTKGKQKITKNKSPSKKALKLLVKETETDLDVDECSLSPLKQDLQKQKFKRVMRQFVSSKIVGIAGNSSVALEDGEGEQDLEGEREGMDHIWSPSQQRTPKGKMKASHSQNIGCAYLSPGDEGELHIRYRTYFLSSSYNCLNSMKVLSYFTLIRTH